VRIKSLWVPEGMEIRNQAKFADILIFASISFPYLILSDKFVQAISKLQLPNNFIYPLNVTKGEKTLKYNIFISRIDFAEYIDFQNSVFYSYQFSSTQGPINQKEISISNHNEYWKVINNLTGDNNINASKIVLKTNNIELDMFRLPRGLSEASYLVSELFVEIALKSGLKGLDFIEFGGSYGTPK